MGSHSSKQKRQQPTAARPRASQTPPSTTTASASTSNVPKYDLSKFAVITVIFNPVKYKSRYDLYHNFEAHMSRSGVFLLTVECIFDSASHFGLPRQKFEVTRTGNLRHLQLVAPSIIWMKENLINIAVKSLPRQIEYVAWIDADVEFTRLDWPHLTIDELQRYPIVQLFELSYFLGPEGKSDVLRQDYSFAYSIKHNKPIDPRRSQEWYAHPGYAWAMRRSTFQSIGCLLDFSILGSGDLHFAYALLNRITETFPVTLHQDYRQMAVTWGNRVAQVAQNGANVGYVPVNLWHHWHGKRSDRSYVERWGILDRHQFSPLNDLEKNDDTGLLRLADKTHFGQSALTARMKALELDIVNYFLSRNEDGKVKEISRPTPHPPPSVKPKPAPTKTPIRHGGTRPAFSSSSKPFRSGGGRGMAHIWSSGPAGTHVDDDNPYLQHCTCPGHHHHHDNIYCPCSPDQTNDPTCWNPIDDGHHHHDHHPNDYLTPDEHYHHHHDQFGGHDDTHHDHHHHHDSHDNWQAPSDQGGFHYDQSSGGGGFDYHGGADFGGGGHSDFGAPGSFY